MIAQRVPILIWAVADGISTSFTLDLLNDPYWIAEPSGQRAGTQLVNWFANAQPIKNPPIAVAVVSGIASAELAGTVVTLQVEAEPAGTIYYLTLELLFAPTPLAGHQLPAADSAIPIA